jgi:hypothetical protein
MARSTIPTPYQEYLEALHEMELRGAIHEDAARIAFQNLLDRAGKPRNVRVVAGQPVRTADGRSIVLDGQLVDPYNVVYGTWEAKRDGTDLRHELDQKIQAGYPTDNLLIENTRHALLLQDGENPGRVRPAARAGVPRALRREPQAGAPARPLRLAGALPRFVEGGRALVEQHVGYEAAEPFGLEERFTRNPASYRVERMKLGADRSEIFVNPSLTLCGVSPEVFRYQLGSRSALEWVIDQQQVRTDARSGIVNDPNDPERPRAIVELVEKVIRVSLETMRIVDGLPPLEIIR